MNTPRYRVSSKDSLFMWAEMDAYISSAMSTLQLIPWPITSMIGQVCGVPGHGPGRHASMPVSLPMVIPAD